MELWWRLRGWKRLRLTSADCPARLREIADRVPLEDITLSDGVTAEFRCLGSQVPLLRVRDGERLEAIGEGGSEKKVQMPQFAQPEIVLSPRQAIFATWEYVAIKDAEGRIAAAPTVGCPPAVPIVVSGERIDEKALQLLAYYGFDRVAVTAK